MGFHGRSGFMNYWGWPVGWYYYRFHLEASAFYPITSTNSASLTSNAMLILYRVEMVKFVLPASILDILDFSKLQAAARSCCVMPLLSLTCLIFSPIFCWRWIFFISYHFRQLRFLFTFEKRLSYMIICRTEWKPLRHQILISDTSNINLKPNAMKGCDSS